LCKFPLSGNLLFPCAAAPGLNMKFTKWDVSDEAVGRSAAAQCKKNPASLNIFLTQFSP